MVNPVVFLALGLAAVAYSKYKHRNKGTNPSEEYNSLKTPEDQWFTQYLDHYDVTNDNTWKQRYLVIDEYYKPGGPAFLILDGEWEPSAEKMSDYASVAYAKKLNAIVLQLEHRFYGQSRPTSDLSGANLRYLSSDQALVDAAFFISGMNAKYKLAEDTKWIVFGSSYSANLAVWMRDKFSHLVYASVAYSAPVLARLNFNEYKNAVRDALSEYSQECANAMKMAHLQLKQTIQDGKDLDAIKEKYKLCDPIDNSIAKDVEALLEKLADNPSEIVQYNLNSDTNIEKGCSIMCDESVGTLVDRYGEINKLVLKRNGDECLDYKYYKNVDMMKNVSWDGVKASTGVLQWEYQSCSEFGYYQTSENPSHLFAEDIPLSFYVQRCMDFFGNRFSKKRLQRGVKRTNIIFGGQNVKATRVAYLNGDADPWAKLGITSTLLDESPAILVEGASHCMCSYGASKHSSDTVKNACDQVEEIVTKWAKE